MSGYQRLGYDQQQQYQQQQQQQQEQDYINQSPQHYQYPTQNLNPNHHDNAYHNQIMTPPPPVASPGYHMRSPSPIEPLHQQGYELEDRPYHDDGQRPLEIPMGPGPGGYLSPGDRMQVQPTYSVENLQHSFGHNEAYNEQHEHDPNGYQSRGPPSGQHPNGDYTINPGEHHDAYYNDPYNPQGQHTPNEYEYGDDQPHYWQDEPDSQPILQADSAYGPDPRNVDPSPTLVDQPMNAYTDMTPKKQAPIQASTPTPAIKRWKTVKEVQLYNGNLVLDCPIPPRLLNQITHAPPPERDEFTHMRYSAATCDPSDFYNERFTLRQKLFAKPRHTELFIVVTMYNEEEELFARTMMGVIDNIKYMNQRSRSKTWGKEAWKKIVVCVVSDGRAKINPRTRAVLAAMGCYQEGIAKQQVNGKDVTAHIYEYTTQMELAINKGVVSVKKGETPVQMLFCLKEKNQKKINSHRWFFQAFGSVLDPNICVLIDAGTKPGKDSVYQLWKAFDINPQCAGACGEIKAMIVHGKKLLNPLIAAQNFEYKISNILDKPLESVFGFISVLPGAFSAYRYVALQNDARGQGPLEKYFAGEKMHGANAGVFTANMYLAEDRILCFELVAKRKCNWTLQYVKSATGETDVPEEMADFILQRRRWLNGSFFAAIYALAHSYQIFRSGHNPIRKFMFLFEFLYQTINMVFAWFAIGNFFLVFRILTTSLADPSLLGTPGRILAVVFEWLYLVTLVSCFVLSLGNRPQGSNKLYMTMVYFWVFIMAYLMFAAIFITVTSIEAQLATHAHITVQVIFQNSLFIHLMVSMAATYALYFTMSLLFFDPWHMFTSFVQYILLTPTYVNILNVYAFCNTHDITWGTKGDDKPAKLPTATVKPSGGIDVAIPHDDADLNTQYEAELMTFNSKYVVPPKMPSASDKQEDYYKGFRTSVVLVWMFCNLALAAAVLNTNGFESLYITKPTVAGVVSADGEDQEVTTRSTIYMAVVLWSVAGLAAVRFVGSFWFLVLRFFRGV